MKKVIVLMMFPLVLLMGCGESSTNSDYYENHEFSPSPTNYTESEAPVTEYVNPYGHNLTVWTVSHGDKTCIVASVNGSVTMDCS